MIKKITLIIVAITGSLITISKAQPGVTPQYPYIQTFDSLAPFQTIEGQAAWLNGNFFGIDQSTVSVYASRGIDNTQAMSTALNDFLLTDSILTPILGTFTAASELSFYYRVMQPTLNLPHTLTADGGIKLSILPYVGVNPEPEQELYRISSANHVDTNGYRKVTFSLAAFDGKTGHIKFSYYQGTPGDDFMADIDSFVVNEPTITSIKSINSEKYFVVINEQNQILINIKSDLNQNEAINIFDMSGKTVFSSNGKSNNIIDASIWNKGLYLVQITDGKNRFTKKIMVR